MKEHEHEDDDSETTRSAKLCARSTVWTGELVENRGGGEGQGEKWLTTVGNAIAPAHSAPSAMLLKNF